MAVVVELQESRPQTFGENGSGLLRYGITGTTDDTEAKNALLAQAPLVFGGLVLQGGEINPTEAADFWEGVLTYGPLPQREVGDSQYQFETGGGTERITQAISQTGYVASGTAPDVKKAIGVTKNSVEGVDITVPVFNWTETHIVPASNVTDAYIATLFSLTGKKNGDAFRNYSPGEVLFLGSSGTNRDAETFAITFKFAASQNATSIQIGDITVATKRGWDYLWVLYEDEEDATANKLVKRPVAAYVAEVYRDGTFSELGLG